MTPFAADRPLLTPDELGELLGAGSDEAVASEAVLVDLGVPARDEADARRIARAAHVSGSVLIGVATGLVPQHNAWLANAMTLSVAPLDTGPEFIGGPDPLAAAGEVAAAVARRPLAAASLAVLLQQTGVLPVWEGLIAESATYSLLLAGPEFQAWLAGSPSRKPPPEDDEPVLVERDGDVLQLTLNRPERRNAYGRRMRDALVSALAIARFDESVQVELAGRGPAFSSGGDLAEFGTFSDPATAHLVRIRHGAALGIHDLADRVTARIHGACIGAGIELPAFAGRVIAAPDTRIGLPEVAMGLVPGAGGTVSIVKRIGRWRTAWLALTGEHLDAERAQAWGLVDAISPS